MSEIFATVLLALLFSPYLAGCAFAIYRAIMYAYEYRAPIPEPECSTILPPPRNKRVFRTAEVVYYKHCDVMWPDTLVEAGKSGHKVGLCSGEGTEQI